MFKKSVDSITKNLSIMVAELNSLAEKKEVEISNNNEAIMNLNEENEKHALEMKRAHIVSKKLSDLFSN